MKNLLQFLKEKDEYEKMKDKLLSENEKYKIMRLSGIKSKIWVEKINNTCM